jgi:hypothetical protein
MLDRPLCPGLEPHLLLVAACEHAEAGGVQRVHPRRLGRLARAHEALSERGERGALLGPRRGALERRDPGDEGHGRRARLRRDKGVEPGGGSRARPCRRRWACRRRRGAGRHELQQDGEEHGVACRGVSAAPVRASRCGGGASARRAPGGAGAARERGRPRRGGGWQRRSQRRRGGTARVAAGRHGGRRCRHMRVRPPPRRRRRPGSAPGSRSRPARARGGPHDRQEVGVPRGGGAVDGGGETMAAHCLPPPQKCAESPGAAAGAPRPPDRRSSRPAANGRPRTNAYHTKNIIGLRPPPTHARAPRSPRPPSPRGPRPRAGTPG